jgi:hypothetical protein
MAFNIQDFADNIGRYGTLPVSKFNVEITVPGVLGGAYGVETSRVMSMRAERVNMPGIVFDAYESRRYGVGPRIKTPTGKSRFNEVSIDFIDTSDMAIAKFFYDWMYNIVDVSGSGGTVTRIPTFMTGYKEDYCVNMIIKVYNSAGTESGVGGEATPILRFGLVEAFPISMADAGLAWSRTNELFKTSVVFAYTNHQLLQGSGSSLAIQNT